MSNKSYSDRLKNSNLPVCHTPILYQLNTAKRRITQTTPRDSAGTLAFRRQVSLVEDPFPEVCTQSDPPPSENADFDRFRLIVLQPWELAKNSIIGSRKSITRFPSSHRWTLCVTPKSPKSWLKTKICTFGVALHFFVAGNGRHFKLNMWVEHSKSQPTDDRKPDFPIFSSKIQLLSKKSATKFFIITHHHIIPLSNGA